MISSESSAKVTKLIEAIKAEGLSDLVAENHAYETLVRIIKTGSSLPGASEEPDDVTEACVSCFVVPSRWGWMTDRTRQQEWRDFCEKYEGEK